MARALIPNSTQIPDVILDHWMAELSGAEFKVLLYVARRTYGFGKESDNISLNQMAAGIRRRDGTWLDHGTGLSRSGVKAACNSLIQRGILVRVNNRSEESRECEESTYRLNLFAASTEVGQKKAYVGHKEAQVGQEKAYVGQKEAHVGQENAAGGPESDREVGQKLAPQETVQETDQETAAGEGMPGKPAEAAAALIEELVGHGVGRAAATHFAHEKPDTCRRCLEYLPYAKLKSTKGAWLANAIRDEYGPPPGYEEAKAKHGRKRDGAGSELAQMALHKHEHAIRAEKTARLTAAYRQLEETGGEALQAFNEYVEQERATTDRFAVCLTDSRRAEVLAAFDQPEHRLQLFEDWTSAGSGYPLQRIA